MGMRSTRAGFRILLFAMAVQAITPDLRDLASSRLFRLVSSGLSPSRAPAGAPTPSRTPVPLDQDDQSPDDSCGVIDAGAASRVRLETGARLRVQFLLADLPEHLGPLTLRASTVPGTAIWTVDRSNSSLCRFRC